MNPKHLGFIMLLIMAFIWGAGFVAQKLGSEHMGAFGFNTIRFVIATISLGFLLLTPLARQTPGIDPGFMGRPSWVYGGVIAGIFLFAGMACQQIGLGLTTSGKTGFITGLYVLFVPLVGLLMGQRIRSLFWLAVAASIFGLFLLSYGAPQGQDITDEAKGWNMGDGVVLLGVFFWTGHILVIGKIASKAEGIRLNTMQSIVVVFLSLLAFWIASSLGYETQALSWQNIKQAFWALMFVGVLSSAVAFTLQILGQALVSPILASILMSLEAFFAFMAGIIFLAEPLNVVMGLGAVAMIGGAILAQLLEVRTVSED